MTFNIWTFLLEAVNFLVLAYVLQRLLYRPLREAIDRRREAHETLQAEAEKARDEARHEQQQLQSELSALDQKRQEMLHAAHEQAADERRKLLDDAEDAVRKRNEAARSSMARERDEALTALRSEVIAQGVEVARRLLSEAADLALDDQLERRLVERLQQMPDEDRENFRRNWHPGDMVVLESARDLDHADVDRITEAVATILNQQPNVILQRRDSLIGGVRLRLGGQVWDASIEGQLNGISSVGE